MKIIVRLKGGLGNQLFIYAFARALQARTGADLKVDLQSGFKRDRYFQRYSLTPFRVNITASGGWESYCHPFGKLRRNLVKFVDIRRPISLRRYVTDPEDCYRPELAQMDVDHAVYFEGYWESPRYFEDCEPALRTELKMVAPTESESLQLSEAIAGCDAIAVHARRLKSVPSISGAKPNELHPQLTLDYYHRAVEQIAQRCRNPKIFCFSDYPEWFLEHYKPEIPVTYVTHNHHGGDATSWKDLWLMRQCRHFVIANSSFSWWGAWLSEHPGKIVIYPEPASWKWTRNVDMMPAKWLGRPA